MTECNVPCSLTEEQAMRRVKEYIRRIAENPVPGTATGTVLDEMVDASGKMIRARLILQCGRFGPAFGRQADRLCQLAALVELTHLASLIHDDIIDDAPYRRGKPSVQSRFGKDAAVYAGDFLIARTQFWLAKEQLNAAAMRICAAVERMCIGEVGQDLCKYRTDSNVADYTRNIRGKTASLFEAACAMGAEQAGCDEATVRTLERFGSALGMLFQLRDDLLDFTSTAQQEGKQTHKDFRDGIYTLPVLLAMESDEGRSTLLPLMEKNSREPLTDAEIGQMERLVVQYGGVARTREAIHRYAAEAGRALDELGEHSAAKTLKGMLGKLDEPEHN